MVRQGGIGIGGVVSEHGWLYENRDSRGGLEKALLVDGLRDRFDSTREEAEQAIEWAKKFNAVYEKGSKVYLNAHYNRRTKTYDMPPLRVVGKKPKDFSKW